MLAVRLKEIKLRSDISCEHVFPCSVRCRMFPDPYSLTFLRWQPCSAPSIPSSSRSGRVSLPALRPLLSSGLPFPSAGSPSAPYPRAFPLPLHSKLAGGNAVFPLCLLTYFFFFSPPSLYLFIFFLSFSRPHGVTLTDFWWVAGSTRQCTWWWWFYCASDLQSIAEVPVMPTAVI